MSFVTGLPRSRTYWFSKYLQAYGLNAVHEYLNGCHSKKQFYDAVRAGMINCDCGLYLTDWEAVLPDAKCVVIHRPDAWHSLKNLCARIGWPEPGSMSAIADKLRAMRGLHVNFYDINDRLEEIHNYLVDVPFDHEIASRMIEQNLQATSYSFDNDSYQLWVGG